MRLIDLNPRWVGAGGNERLGITFDCPHCLTQRLGVAFHHAGHEAMEDEVIHAKFPGEGFGNHIWTLLGAEDFATMSLMPSVDASKAGHWHGFITNGEVK